MTDTAPSETAAPDIARTAAVADSQPVDADLVPPGACTLIALSAIALFFILAVSSIADSVSLIDDGR